MINSCGVLPVQGDEVGLTRILGEVNCQAVFSTHKM